MRTVIGMELKEYPIRILVLLLNSTIFKRVSNKDSTSLKTNQSNSLIFCMTLGKELARHGVFQCTLNIPWELKKHQCLGSPTDHLYQILWEWGLSFRFLQPVTPTNLRREKPSKRDLSHQMASTGCIPGH